MRNLTVAAPQERGAAAVEFALIAPLLVLLIFGMIEFGWFFFSQANVAGAAREAAREMAITQDPAKAKAVAVNAAKPTTTKLSDVTILPGSCTKTDPNATVAVTVVYPSLTGMFGKNFTAIGTGVMRCGG